VDVHNKNSLVSHFFHEQNKVEEERTRKHVQSCGRCQNYLNGIEQIDQALHEWKDEKPLPHTFDRILEDIPVSSKPAPARTMLPLTPILQIAFSIVCIVVIIYIIQTQIHLLPFWENLQKLAVIEVVGSFGFVAIIFFSIGTFVTFCLAPIMLFDAQKTNIFNRV